MAVDAPALRHDLLHQSAGSQVWLGVHHVGDMIGASITAEEDGHTGALADVSLTFQRQQLERLGKIGRTMLEKLAGLAKIPLKAGADASGYVADIAKRIGSSA